MKEGDLVLVRAKISNSGIPGFNLALIKMADNTPYHLMVESFLIRENKLLGELVEITKDNPYKDYIVKFPTGEFISFKKEDLTLYQERNIYVNKDLVIRKGHV